MPNYLKHFSKLATQDNDGTTWNANGNYSVTPGSFELHPDDTTSRLEIHRLIVSIRDANITNSNEYGSITELTNGVTVALYDGDDTKIIDLTAFAVKTNGDWGGHCYDMTVLNLGSGDDYVLVRWTFSRGGQPILLDGNDGHYIKISLNDNLTGLVEHRFLFHGHYIDEEY